MRWLLKRESNVHSSSLGVRGMSRPTRCAVFFTRSSVERPSKGLYLSNKVYRRKVYALDWGQFTHCC